MSNILKLNAKIKIFVHVRSVLRYKIIEKCENVIFIAQMPMFFT